MCYIASYGNQYQEIAQRLTEVATCDDEFFLLFATLNKVPKNTTTGLSATFEKLNLNTTSLYNWRLSQYLQIPTFATPSQTH